MTPYKLVVLGESCVGKTALINKASNPTVEDKCNEKILVDGQIYDLEITDTAGSEEYIALRDGWIRAGEGFLLAYSVTFRDSFDRVKLFHNRILEVHEIDNVPIVLVGNKCDDVTKREVTEEEGADLAKELGCDFSETSAKTGVNVKMPFQQIAKAIRAQKDFRKSYEYKENGRKKKNVCLIL